MSFDEEFKQPSAWYRSAPFWAWNDRLEIEQLHLQIEELHKQGFGGFFMHSREGLETPYLGNEWDGCIQSCVEKARQLGMEAWLYDEDRWPSGSCGGVVSEKHPLRGLTMEVCNPPLVFDAADPSIRALYTARIAECRLFNFQRHPLGVSIAVPDDQVLLVVRLEVSSGSVWFNGSAPPDNLDPATVKAFIESTHEHYRSYLSSSFGSVVPGIFTDEPSLADRHAKFPPTRGWLPWSEGMEQYYASLGHGDVYETLPWLYFQGDGSLSARYVYWHTLALRFEACYSETIGAWCTEHGLLYTGHFLQEDKLGLSTRVNGSIMPHYTHQHMPGIDLLGEQIEEFLTVKQVASVAHQYGKERVVCETYAGCGWDFSFEGQKWVGEWQYLLGVTNRCQHLMLYSLRGNRKRDYPQSFNYHAQWWEKQRVVEDYFARLSVVLQQGEVVRPFLVIHPQSSVWTMIGCDPYGNPIRRNERDVPFGDAVGYQLNALLKQMEYAGLHADLGDETLIQRDGRVCDGLFSIAKASYSVVILPRLTNIYASTYAALVSYIEQGGRLVVLGDAPTRIDARPDPRLDLLFSQDDVTYVEDEQSLISLLINEKPGVVNVDAPSNTVLTRLQKDGSTYYLYVLNTDRQRGALCHCKVSTQRRITRLNLVDGSMKQVQAFDGVWDVSLGRCGSALFKLEECSNDQVSSCCPFDRNFLQYTMVLDANAKVSLGIENVLTLDRCCYALDGASWSDECFTWEAQRDIRARLKMISLDTDEVMQRYRWVTQPHPLDGRTVTLRYCFTVDELVQSPYYLVIEEPSHYQISCNGTDIAVNDCGWYLDHSLRKLELSGVRVGENVLLLTCNYLQSMSFEDIFVCGTFGVSSSRTLRAGVQTLGLGSWTSQGLLHYPGMVSYRHTFFLPALRGRVVLEKGMFAGSCMTYCVNGREYDVPWSEVEAVDVTDAVVDGRNKLEIHVYGSPRNMLGPLHLKHMGPVTNPQSFFPAVQDRTDSYQVVEVGLLSNPNICLYQGELA